MPRYISNPIIKKTESGKRYYSTVLPTDPVEESNPFTVVSRIGDRWDTLAHRYLKSASLWYVLANANGKLDGSLFIEPGTVVIIPQNY